MIAKILGGVFLTLFWTQVVFSRKQMSYEIVMGICTIKAMKYKNINWNAYERDKGYSFHKTQVGKVCCTVLFDLIHSIHATAQVCRQAGYSVARSTFLSQELFQGVIPFKAFFLGNTSLLGLLFTSFAAPTPLICPP